MVRGAPLTDCKIVKYALAGYYGKKWQVAFTPKTKVKRAKATPVVTWRQRIIREYL
jgi:hypothetical protein